jgi:hypothetical protein
MQMVYIESCGLQWGSSLQCMQRAYIKSGSLHKVSISKKTMIEDNQIKAKGTILMSYYNHFVNKN